jgi:hypothetical protein
MLAFTVLRRNKMKNANMPAATVYETDGEGILQLSTTGLTKREMFAMHFMAASRSRNSTYNSWEAMALDSIEMADALLKVLEK